MKYAPLAWVHISEALRPSLRRLRVVLEAPAFYGERAFVRLHDSPRSDPITETRPLLATNQTTLSARERAAVEILHEVGPSHARKGRFSLTRAQMGRLLAFASEVHLEVEGKGGVAVVPKTASIVGKLRETDEGTALYFVTVDHEGNVIHDAHVVGEREAYIIDEQLKLYRLSFSMLPSEAQALLSCKPLLLSELTTDEGRAGFEAVVALGTDLGDLIEVARPSSPPAKIVLQASLVRGEDKDNIVLKARLLTAISADGRRDLVEINSRGALSPVHALPTDEESGKKSKDSKDHKSKNKFLAVTRPVELEEASRQALFDLGLTPASTHRGYVSVGERSLDILMRLTEEGALPKFIYVDQETLPRIIRLPKQPRLSVRIKPNATLQGLLEVRLDIGEEARQLAINFDDIVRAVVAGKNSLLVDDATVLGFAPETGKSLEFLSEALDLHSTTNTREIGTGELAMIISGIDGRVDLDCDDEELKKKLLAFLSPPNDDDKLITPRINVTLRPYQVEGVAWLMRMHRLNVGRILADDMGLGKTLMAMSMLAKSKDLHGSKPNLVVAPTSVLDVWVDEARRHAPSMNVVKWHGRGRDLGEVAPDTDIVVTSYALLRRDVEGALGNINFRYLMLDEAQHVKNSGTEAWKAARQVKCEQRVALTGTPIENRVEELWSILDLVAPGLLGTEKNFERRYGRPISKGDRDRLDELRRRTRPVVLRRKKEDVAKDLPPKIETIMRCEMEKEQRALYLRVLAEVRADVQKALQVHTRARARAPILAALMRLRQVCCDPRLVLGDEGRSVPSGKLQLFAEVMREALASGRRVIVFSQFVEMQKIIHEVLDDVGAGDALWLHGATRDRGAVVAKFQDPNGPKVIVVSLKAGGTGVTLTAADTVVHYDPWWNPAVEDQATDRAHRIGQTKTVHVIKLACEDTIEDRILSLGESKRAAAEAVLGKDGVGPKPISIEDIENMLEAEAVRGY